MGGARRVRVARGRGRALQAQRHGRLHRDRSPVRRHGRSHSHDVDERAGATRRSVWSHDSVRRRRNGTRDDHRTRMTDIDTMPATISEPTLKTDVDGDVLVVTIDRPGVSLNTLTPGLIGEFEGVLSRVNDDTLMQ